MGSFLASFLSSQNLVTWLNCNRGCFLAVRMIETGIGRVVVATRKLVQPHTNLLQQIKHKTKGAEILLAKLESSRDVVESDDEEDMEVVKKISNDEVEEENDENREVEDDAIESEADAIESEADAIESEADAVESEADAIESEADEEEDEDNEDETEDEESDDE